jgi:hypothetical protein
VEVAEATEEVLKMDTMVDQEAVALAKHLVLELAEWLQ